MDINSLASVSSNYLNTFTPKTTDVNTDKNSFSSVLSAAMQSIDETNDLQNNAESEEIRFDLLIAETKANIALQYTVAVRDKLIDGYREIMQMSI